MEAFVEGQWGDFEFRKTTNDMSDQIQDLLYNNFYPDEPLCSKFGYSEDLDQDCQNSWRPQLENGFCFAAFEKGTNQLAGIRISMIQRPNDTYGECKSECFKKIYVIMNMLDKDADVFKRYGVQECASLFLTCVHRDFRGRGLVTEMYRRSIALTKALGLKVIKVCFSSPYSRKGAANVGFQEVAAVKYGELKDEDGNPLFPYCIPGDLMTQSVYIHDI